MGLFQLIKVMKYIKMLVYGSWGSGKSTLALTAPKPIYIIDAEHGTDNLRDPGDKVLYTNSVAELQEAINEIRNSDCATLIIDPYTIFWQRLIDHVENETKNGLQFQHWGKIKKPNSRIITDLLNLNCHVILTAHQADEYEMQPNEKGGLTPVKVGVKIDSEKKTAYAPDVVIRMAVENGVHVGYIEKIRARKEIVAQYGLGIGSRHENPTWALIAPIAQEFSIGTEQAQYDNEKSLTEKDEKVFEQIANEQEQLERNKIIKGIEKVEAKAHKMGLYGYRDDSEIVSSRKTMLGDDGLNTDIETLKLYGRSVDNMTKAGKVE